MGKAYKKNDKIESLGGIMKDMKERIAEVSQCLQKLTEPEVFPEVQNAVERKDRKSLLEICKKVHIPEIHTNTIVSALLSVGPNQVKWPWPDL